MSVGREALSSRLLEVLTVWSSVTALTQQKPEITPPDFSTVQVTDIFHKLVRIPRLEANRQQLRALDANTAVTARPVHDCCCRGPCRCSAPVPAGGPFM